MWNNLKFQRLNFFHSDTAAAGSHIVVKIVLTHLNFLRLHKLHKRSFIISIIMMYLRFISSNNNIQKLLFFSVLTRKKLVANVYFWFCFIYSVTIFGNHPAHIFRYSCSERMCWTSSLDILNAIVSSHCLILWFAWTKLLTFSLWVSSVNITGRPLWSWSAIMAFPTIKPLIQSTHQRTEVTT